MTDVTLEIELLKTDFNLIALPLVGTTSLALSLARSEEAAYHVL